MEPKVPAAPKIGKSHLSRKALFRQGVRDGFLTVDEIETALPAGALTSAERWLLYYSLRAAEIEILGDASDLDARGQGSEDTGDEATEPL